jgi:hypothetical protein
MDGEALESLVGMWRVIKLSAQPRSRSNSEKKTSHNIEQHLYGFDIE